MTTFEEFIPPLEPVPGEVQTEPRVLTAGFGDGYEQRAGDGLNAIRRTYPSVTFGGLNTTQKNALLAFLEGRAGYRPFRYTMPGDTAERRWTAPKWGMTLEAKDVFTVTATFRQVFDL